MDQDEIKPDCTYEKGKTYTFTLEQLAGMVAAFEALPAQLKTKIRSQLGLPPDREGGATGFRGWEQG